MKYIFFFFFLVAMPVDGFAFEWPSFLSKSDTQKQKAQPSVAAEDSKAENYFKSCRYSSLTTLLNIIKDAKSKHAELDAFSLEKCTRLRNLGDTTNIWNTMKDVKFEGCTMGVDVAIGMSPADDGLRRKFKTDLCL